MEEFEDWELIQISEPVIFNNWFESPADPELGDEICQRFGQNGGDLMEFAIGKISFANFKMLCDIRGCDDYGVDLLERIAKRWDHNVSYLASLPYRIPRTEDYIKVMKSRLVRLKFEINQLKLRAMDKF